MPDGEGIVTIISRRNTQNTTMIKTIFLDRDGVINSVIMRGSQIDSPRAFHEFHVRRDFLLFYNEAQLRKLELFVVSNQPDVKRGLLKVAELNLMTELLG